MIKRILILVATILFFSIHYTPYLSDNVIAGTIDIYSPYSGDTYYAGDSVYIGWNTFDAGNYVKIEVYRSSVLYYSVSSNTSNDGSYSWTVPSSASESSYYRIKVTSLSDGSYDYSSYFSISDRTITVTSPTSTDTWYTGTYYTISWNSNNIGAYVKIELYNNGVYDSTISSSLYSYSGARSYSWRVPTNQETGSEYQIKITSNSYSSIYDYSQKFSISKRSITVTSPDNGDILYIGGTKEITWNSDNAGNYVEIELLKNGYHSYNIDTYAKNDGIYEWTIPNGMSLSSNYQIKIESRSYSSVYDISDYFEIDERYININFPSSGDTWFGNESYNIIWNSKNAGNNVNIKLYKNDIFCSIISSETENDGSFEWNVSDVFAAASNYRIKIRSESVPSLYGQSSYFSIGERTIEIKTPDEGENWARGSKYTISWDSENIGNYVKIELYENGKYHSTIASNYYSPESYFSESTYSWTIPSDLKTGEKYEIKISSLTYDGVESYSEGYFVVEESLLQKITGPLIILLAFLIMVISTIILLRIRRKRAIEDGGGPDDSHISFESNTKPPKIDIGSEEYNQIWEKNNF